jgi:hypothetical protein
MKPVVYIASPYTKGDPAINTHFQMRVFTELMNDGVVWPFIPLVSHFIHSAFPRDYRDWIDYDLALIDRMDACLRLDAVHKPLDYRVAESTGADGEVARFVELGKPVFYDKEALYAWVGNREARSPRNVLQIASNLVHGDRGANYGHPGDDFVCTAEIVTAILKRQGKLADGKSVSPEDWALFMVACKLSREAHQPKEDNRIDGAGYFETLQMIHERQREAAACT